MLIGTLSSPLINLAISLFLWFVLGCLAAEVSLFFTSRVLFCVSLAMANTLTRKCLAPGLRKAGLTHPRLSEVWGGAYARRAQTPACRVDPGISSRHTLTMPQGHSTRALSRRRHLLKQSHKCRANGTPKRAAIASCNLRRLGQGGFFSNKLAQAPHLCAHSCAKRMESSARV